MARMAALALAALALPVPALAGIESEPVVTARTRASLLVGEDAAWPGGSLSVALRLQLRPGWHTYWRNPGDSGEPASVKLRLDGRDIQGPHAWPTPERIDIAGIISYGHHGEVLLVSTVPVPAATSLGSVLRLEAEATWLVCEKVCVPEQGRFALTVTAVPGGAVAPTLQPPPLPTIAALFDRTAAGWVLRLPLAAMAAADGPVVEAYFFPERSDLIDHSAPQPVREWAGEMVLELASAQLPGEPPDALRGVLAVTRQRPDGGRQTRHFGVAARPVAATR